MGADWWGPPSIKKNYIFFGKKSHFFGFFFGSNFAECRALSKGFAECPLPSAALGKAFAKYKLGFTECPRHSAKPLSPVVGVAKATVKVSLLV